MQQAPSTRLRCDPTDYARKQQEKKDRAKDLKEQRQRGVFQEEHTFTPKVNPRSKGAPSSREEDERPAATMQRGATSSHEDVPIRPSKALLASRKEILSPEEVPAATRGAARKTTGNSRPNNNDDHGYGDQDSDSLDSLSRKFPKKPAARQPQRAGPDSPPAPLEPEHDSLYREVKRTTGRDLEDIPIQKLNAASKAGKHTGPCLRNSSCGCPQCSGMSSASAGGSAMRPDPPIRRREPKPDPADDCYGSQASTSRSAYGAHSEMENSLTLLKSKMSRSKARSAPSNQASLYYEKPPPEPAVQSARQAGGGGAGYASSSSGVPSRRASSQAAAAAPPANTRASQAQAAAPTNRKQPARYDEDERSAPPANRRLARHQEQDEEDEPVARSLPPPISSGFKDGEEPDEYADGSEEMRECGNCHRRFNVISLQKHQKVCEKVFSGPRKVFDMASKRLEGTEAEKLLKQAKRGGGSKKASGGNDEKPIKAKAVDWKKQSEAFREAMRANRDVNQALKEGRPLPPMAPSAPDPSLIQCDHCGRRFNDKAAERHIAFCKEKSARDMSKGPAKKPAAAAPKPATKAPPRKR